MLKMTVLVSLKALLATLGNAKEYTLKQYLSFADKLQKKAKVTVIIYLFGNLESCSLLF